MRRSVSVGWRGGRKRICDEREERGDGKGGQDVSSAWEGELGYSQASCCLLKLDTPVGAVAARMVIRKSMHGLL